MRQLDLFGMPVKTDEETTVTETAIQPGLSANENFEAEPEIITPQAIEREGSDTIISPDESSLNIFPAEDDGHELREEILVNNEVFNVEEIVPVYPRLTEPIKKRGRKSFREMDAELDLIEIPEDDILFQKQYYAISEVAQWFKVNTSLLRFWETEFDVLKPRKNRKGDRLFRPEDVKSLQVIYYLLRNRKFTIEGAKEYLKTNRKKAEGNVQVIQSLTKFRSFLVELRANLD
ncbi:MAG: transcriptional regulator [Chitinophagaceae bacterium]|nr:transcriptional regulator [Chitinophagaceae bacterium]